MGRKHIFSHILILLANLIYGLNFTIAKIPMPEYIKPLGFVLMRGLAASLFFGVGLFFIKESVRIFTRNDFIRLALCAVFGIFLNQLLFFQGLEYTSPIGASIIMTLSPVMVLVWSYFILKEPLNTTKIFGVLLGMSGAVLLIVYGSGNGNENASNPFLGNILVFINGASYALYLVLVKPLLNRYNPMLILGWLFILGTIYIFPFGIQQLIEAKWSQMNTQVILAILFVLVFVSCLTYLFNLTALKNVKPSTVAIYIYTQPLFATIVAILWNYDSLSWIKILSGTLIFIAVFLVSKSNRAKSKKAFVS